MPDLFSETFSGSLPPSFASVNTGGNTFNFAGPNSFGAHFRNDSTDGANILGIYVTSGNEVAAANGRVFENKFTQNTAFNADGRRYLLAVQLATGLDMFNATTFGIYKDGLTGIYAQMRGGTVALPDDAVVFDYTADGVYTARIKVQPDNSLKAYIEGPGTGGELFIGSSKESGILRTFWSPGTDMFMSTNSFKSWTAGGGGTEVNNFRVYDPASGGAGRSTASRLIAMGKG